MGFADRLRELDKSMKEKKKAKAAAEAAKLEAAKKAQEELFRGMSKAERKAHEVAERHRKQEEEQGMEVAGGFGKTTVNYQKRKLEEEEKERIRRHKQWVKDMKMIEPVLQRREIREMSVEDTASAVFSRLENRARHYQELVEAETARQVRLKEEQALAAEEHEKMIEPGFSFNRGKFKDAHKNKPTEGRLIKRFKGHKLPVKRVFFDDSGEYLVTCGMDKLIKVWSIKSEECVHAFSGHRHGVTCCSILGTYGAKRNASSKTPKGKRRRPYTPTDTEMPTVVVKKKQFRVMSGDGSGSVFFWVEGSERCVLQRQVHDAVIYDCAFSPREHGRWAMSFSGGGSPIAGYIIAARAFGGQTKTSTEGSKEEGKQDGGKVIVPDGYEIIGSTGPSITKFLFTKPRIRAFYTFRVSCYNHVGQSDFTESPESIQVPSKVEYIAKLQKQKMEQIAEEKKRRAYAKKLQLGGEKEKVNIEE
eukprot:Stramenopile-MAST_4_protein_1946